MSKETFVTLLKGAKGQSGRCDHQKEHLSTMQSRHGDIDGLSAPSAVGNLSMFSHCEKQYKENLGRLTRL